MSDSKSPSASGTGGGPALEQGTYEILRARLTSHGAELRTRLEKLNVARQEVFGAIKTGLLATERVTTSNNCTPRDIIPIGEGRFLLGYNVHVGLRSEIQLSDVFALYRCEDRAFSELPLSTVADAQFETDFKALYKYYKDTVFTKFSLIEPHLFMEFRIGQSVTDIKTFKWLLQESGGPAYLGNRFDHEYLFPPQHEFTWTRTHRELHRHGVHPHISIEDRVFVECIHGDLTIKVEDNTASGQGIYSEPVDHPDQTLDDAEIYYAVVDSLILLKVRPYQEKTVRYFVFNEKLKEVRRIDSIADACVLLPDGHGIIFPNGYYLQSGEFKLFDGTLKNLSFYKRIAAPNGEDTLFAFYQRETGEYVLLSYNLIARSVETPIVCHGFSIFENGEMAIFRGDAQPQKHHVVQIWQTPYVGASWQPEVQPSSYLYKIGNPTLVAAMAECQHVLTLLGKEDSYAGLYLDLVRETGGILDSYFWLDHAEAGGLREPLLAVKEAAAAALAEFEKVAAIKKSTAAAAERVLGKTQSTLSALATDAFEKLEAFVGRLAELRSLRGEIIALKELRYIDLPKVDEIEKQVAAAAETLAQRTVDFLLEPKALDITRERVSALQTQVPLLAKVTEGQKLGEELTKAGQELDLLIETVSNLKIQDATESTRIIEDISGIYAGLNQARAGLKQRLRDLRGTEAVAEFASQSRLLDQSLANFLDLCTTAEKCDEYLNRLMVQIEELEARFAEFDQFVIELSEKRSAVAGAFEARKIELVESRNRQTSALLTAAERILKGIKHRAESFEALEAIHGYFASDLMVQKVRDQIAQLIALGDSVKADDLQSRLKTVREDAVRQLKDRQELFVGGSNTIQLGRHQFLVNTQELDLTVVPRGEGMSLHLTGTNFFEPIEDAEFAETKSVWSLEVVSETPEIYRAEYLAYRLFQSVDQTEAQAWTDAERLKRVREFAAPRYAEGYVKGVHDEDAARIFAALIEMHTSLGLLRYSGTARAAAAVFWHQFPDAERKALLTGKVQAYAAMQQLFPGGGAAKAGAAEFQALLGDWLRATVLFPADYAAEAAEYLVQQLQTGGEFVISSGAAELHAAFQQHLTANLFADTFAQARRSVESDLPTLFAMLREWMRGFSVASGKTSPPEVLDECAWLLLRDRTGGTEVVHATGHRVVEGLTGSHASIQLGRLEIDYVAFLRKLRAHEGSVVPRHERFQTLKKSQIAEARDRLGLANFQPKVLTSFVRNRLIDSAYLPLVGDNLAKQIGAAGDAKRTDRMGLLLLVSPPGYGKTTLVEYLASRLGIVFIKINGPAIGHRVTSLDPAEAPNAAAREELNRLNLALEMGDNVMICLDDIQHLSPEFLQKFISLCDGSRRIEGVYRGEARTYDLRGRKVAVVMAGNPYTESGEKFKIPDMLSNRADTYNLGDIVGQHAEVFRSSYLENSATSNPTLARIAGQSHRDLLAVIKLAEGVEGGEFEHTYAPEELSEAVGVMKKLIRVRDVVLRVNEEYIRSAAQAEAYRTEPAFKMQGSYRNMNRLAEKISPVMNEAELETLIQTHYRSEAQTLTTGAEANLLKLRELTEALTDEERARLEEIRKTFRKNKMLRGGDERDPVTQVVRQLSACYEGITSIKDVLSAGLQSEPTKPAPVTIIVSPPGGTNGAGVPEIPGIQNVQIDQRTLEEIWKIIHASREPVDKPRVPNGNALGL